MFCAGRARQADGRQPLARRKHLLKKTYNLTPAEYEAMIVAQAGKCAICGGNDLGKKNIWHIDHCHESGAVRGLLCSRCNVGLGQFQDDPERLRAAAGYIEHHRNIKP